MRKMYALSMFLALVLLFGCTGLFDEASLGGDDGIDGYVSSGGNQKAGVGTYESAPQALTSTSASPVAIPGDLMSSSGRMVVKTGDVNVEVAQGTIKNKFDSLKQLVAQQGGTMYSYTYSETKTRKEYYAMVKLPPNAFESFPTLLEQLGAVKSADTNTDDVTDQYVDLQAKIQNLEASKKRLTELYNMSTQLKDILSLEKEITRVQTDLDYYNAQKISLERQVRQATLTVHLYEEAPAIDQAIFMPIAEYANIFLGALNVALMLVIAVSGFLVPLAVLLLVLFLMYKLYRKARGKGRK